MSEEILERTPPQADLRIPYGRDPSQFGELRLPAGPGPYPVLVVVHGGFWRAKYDLTHIGHLCAAFTEAGVATWNVEYRRLGNGGGWPNTFLDIAAAMDHVRALAGSFPLDVSRVTTLGHSAGGQLAFWLAARHLLPKESPLFSADPVPVAAAVALAGVLDLVDGWEQGLGHGAIGDSLGGGPRDVPDRYAQTSPAAMLPLGVPQVLIHGTEDADVPFKLSVRYREKATAAGDQCELLALTGSGHFEPINPHWEEWPGVRDAVLALL